MSIENNKPIVFINKPIQSREEDVIGVEAHIASVKEAIDKDANIIGIVSGYGTGKSSIVDIMSKEHKSLDCITINMWDSLENNNDNNENESLGVLIKSFIYQLGKKKRNSIGNHVNKMLSNNYNIFSFSAGFARFWICLFFALLFVSLFFIAGSSKNADVINNFLGWNINNVKFYLLIARLVSLIIAVILIVVGLKGTHLVLSRFDKSERRKAGINEVFAAYSYVYKKLARFFKKTVVVIEDLDRISDADMIRDFLKELYRINNICVKVRFRKRPVFIVAISKENTDKDDIFSKMFDYEIELNSIHIDDYNDVLRDILDKDITNKRRLMKLLFGENHHEENEEKLLNYCSWLCKGEGLTIRELKDRLNKTVEKYCDIRNKGYQREGGTNFETCAAIVYLENQYPRYYYPLISKEKSFDGFVEETYNILRGEEKAEQKEQIKAEINKIELIENKENESYKEEESYELFIEELSEMVIERLINHEYRMYFYAYPKGSYIKSGEEEYICNRLELPNKYEYDESTIKDKINVAIRERKVFKIEETIKNIANNDSIEAYPEIIFEHEFLFDMSVEYGKGKTIISAVNLIRNKYPEEKTIRLLKQLSSYEQYTNEYEEQYIDEICKTFSLLEPTYIIDMRKKLIVAFGKNIINFKKVFIESDEHTAPLLSKEEMDCIGNHELSVELVDINNIRENDIDYIQDFICDVGNIESVKEILIEIQKRIIHIVGFEEVQERVLDFMTSSCIVDVFLFELACDQVRKDELESEKLADYLNSLDLELIPEEYFREINALATYIDISDSMLDCLLSKGYYDTALVVCTKDNKLNKIDFFKEDEEVSIQDSIMRINKKDSELVYVIREHIIREDEKMCLEKYKGLFFDGFSLITKSELEAISTYRIALELIDYGKIDSNNYGEIIEYINSDTREGEECYFTMQNLLMYVKLNTSGMQEMINKIDFDMVKISTLDESEKENVVAWMKQKRIIVSDGVEARKWMLKMKAVTPALEQLVRKELGETQYNEMLNDIGELSSYSKTFITGNEPQYSYCDSIAKELLSEGYKKHYIVGKVLNEKSFDFPMNGVDIDDVITCYSEEFPIIEYLQEEKPFMDAVWENKKYHQLENVTWKSIEPFIKYEQTKDFFSYVTKELSDSIIREYFKTLNTIHTADDSLYIVNRFINGNLMQYIENDEVFEHIKFRIWENDEISSGKKSAFTRKYNEYKQNNATIR